MRSITIRVPTSIMGIISRKIVQSESTEPNRAINILGAIPGTTIPLIVESAGIHTFP